MKLHPETPTAYLSAFLRPFLLALALSSALLAVVSWSLLEAHQRDAEQSLAAGERLRVASVARGLGEVLVRLADDLTLLAGEEPVAVLLASAGAQQRDLLERRFRRLAELREGYQRLRLLDAEGRELFAVSRDTAAAPPDGTARSVHAAAPVFGVGPVSLSVLAQEADLEMLPRLRLTVPLRDADGAARGVLVLIAGTEPLQRVMAAAVPGTELLLLDGDDRRLLGRAQGARERRWPPLQGDSIQLRSGAALVTLAGVPLPPGVAGGPWRLASFLSAEARQATMLAERKLQWSLALAALAALALVSGLFAHASVTRGREAAAARVNGRVVEVTRDGVVVADRSRRVIRANRAFVALTGFAEADVLGRDLKGLHMAAYGRTRTEAIWDKLLAEGSWQGDLSRRARDGALFVVAASARVLRDGEGNVSHYVEVFSDVTDSRRAELRPAHHDPLTGLPDRYLLEDRMQMALATAGRQRSATALILVVLDGLGVFNRERGMEAGDAVLCEVARRLRACCSRRGDVVARLGGNRFGVMLQDLAMPDDAEPIAERIRRMLREPIGVSGVDQWLEPTVVLAVSPCDGDGVQALFARAEAQRERVAAAAGA